MLRWKLLKYFIAFFPLLSVLALPISEPIKKQIVDRNEVRWYRIKDPATRTETIAVKNGADTALSKVRVHLNIPANMKAVVSDFDFGIFESGPRTSFLDSLGNLDSLRSLENKDFENILRITDLHSDNRTLHAIDKALDESRSFQLQQVKIPKNLVDAAGQQQWSHDLWLKMCMDRKMPDLSCRQVNSVLSSWEFLKHSLWLAAEKRWREDTGIVVHADNQISPQGNMYFDMPLGANDSGFLRIHYGLDEITPVVNISSADNYTITKVRPQDLRGSAWWITPYYHTIETFIAVALIILCLLIAWPLLRPLQFLPIYKIFNTAIKTNDDDAWDLAFKKYRYFIIVQFKSMMSGLKERMAVSHEEIFDFIKYGMRGYFGPHSEKFRSDEELERFIGQQLEILVAVVAYADP